jgi:hypothetical protein
VVDLLEEDQEEQVLQIVFQDVQLLTLEGVEVEQDLQLQEEVVGQVEEVKEVD